MSSDDCEASSLHKHRASARTHHGGEVGSLRVVVTWFVPEPGLVLMGGGMQAAAGERERSGKPPAHQGLPGRQAGWLSGQRKASETGSTTHLETVRREARKEELRTSCGRSGIT